MELVRDRWYIVLDADEVPSGRPFGATRHGEKLVRSDAPIIWFRRWRARVLKEQADSPDEPPG